VKWEKAPKELISLLESAMSSTDCEKKLMFGYPAYFINKNMFIGLFQNKLFARLSPDHLAAIRKKFPEIVNLEPMPGRPMKDYFVLPDSLYTDTRALREIIGKSADFTRTLTPKTAKPKKSSKSSKKTSKE
jgi:hypothetical protein